MDKTDKVSPYQLYLTGDHILSETARVDPEASSINEITTAPRLEELKPHVPFIHTMHSLEELLDRDSQRVKDGFPRKIRLGRLIRPESKHKGKVILVPSTIEEKFIHDRRFSQLEQDSPTGGVGNGQEGDVIAEQPIHGVRGSGSGDGGTGEGADHEIESNAYDLGRILSERLELPNIRSRGKKRFLSRYSYDLTDKHAGTGQVLDKKATLRKIVQTNIGLGTITSEQMIDPNRLMVSPDDKVYRILSKEKDYESQALVFFMRDYSGSMTGKPTEIIATQHVLIYSWLLYQYEKQVETRFVLHDTEAKEVDAFYQYYSLSVAGGTHVSAAYRLVNKIVEDEGLARDYNIYVFHGTDGDDWDKDGRKTLPEIRKMLRYVNRIGITIASGFGGQAGITPLERYLKDSGLLQKHSDLIRLDTIAGDDSEDRLIEGIRKMTA